VLDLGRLQHEAQVGDLILGVEVVERLLVTLIKHPLE
jgi:hypothetical protein